MNLPKEATLVRKSWGIILISLGRFWDGSLQANVSVNSKYPAVIKGQIPVKIEYPRELNLIPDGVVMFLILPGNCF